jgi:uncharacterized membrane protein YbhN (UPF0104 family)
MAKRNDHTVEAEEHKPSGARWLRLLLTIGLLGFAIHILLPQIGEVGDALHVLRTGRWRYLGLALIGSILTYMAGAWTVNASTNLRLSYPRTVLEQFAASLMAVITPAGLGWVAVTDSYLQKAGADEHTAHTATTLTMIITFSSHIVLLIALIPLLPTLRLPEITLPSTQVIIEVVVLTLVVVGVVFWVPASRRRILKDLAGMIRAVPAVLGDPRRSTVMVVAAISGNMAFAIALIGAVAAYGPVPSPLGVLVAYMFAATVGALSPTPGGLGAMEAALVAALTRLGVEAGAAVAAALTFRLVTFWLPLPIGAWALRTGRKNGWL